jgi:predicted RecA/RadA family phage recombinase
LTWTGQPTPATVDYGGYGKISDGKSVKATVPENTTITAGKIYLLDSFLGVAMESVTTGAGATAEVTLSLEEAEYETDQINAAEAFAKGADIYWDSNNKRLTITATALYAGQVTVAKDANNVIWFKLSPRVITNADALANFLRNSVQAGLLAGAPTTPSAHTDAGAFDFNVDVAAGLVKVHNVLKEFAVQADFDIAHGVASPISEAKPDVIYTVVAAEAAGVVTMVPVAGAAATAVAAVAPTTAEITTAVGHANWIRLFNTRLHRTAADGCTQTYDNSVRPSY